MAETGWDFDSNGGSGENKKKTEFTSFPVGVTKIRIIDPAPHVRWTHWMPQFRRSATCPGRGCPICQIRKNEKANGIKTPKYNMTRRFTINVINRELNRHEIMDQGITFFQDEGKKLADVDLKVRRRGTSSDDTSYRIDIADEYALTEDDKKLVAEKVDLQEFFKPQTPEQLTKLLNVKAETVDDYKKAWAEIVTEDEPEKQTSDTTNLTNDVNDEVDIEIK